ncbi:sulfur carrier protein ThiS [Peptostreptococcus equinus]|uniref:Sulfur carrier protein ThiS n=1 Tax=Peptostreptococcus equinus TaxID=3003601 RepID=A0ABY7JPA4_9FIRM|nr:sulfur carrier protein ThiS [Peptostreptococcus sp. CBA3647]WAW14930.1 sulfur carrier protein ThiS [Peptostreptococcus sp. CBA3647]
MAFINGKKVEVENKNLKEIIIEQGYKIDRIAVELNGSIIKRVNYADYIINKEDKVEIVCFVGGG